MQVTREWVGSDDPILDQRRELAALRLRAQYWLLDPFVRGRGCYHRHGNVSGDPRAAGKQDWLVELTRVFFSKDHW